MYEHLVKNVSGRVKDGWLYLSYETSSDSIAHEKGAPCILVGAIETWLAQPKPPTPHDIAFGIVGSWYGKVGSHIDSSKRTILVDLVSEAIQQAIEDDRAARGEA